MIAIFTEDALLRRMLELEVKRCGFACVPATEARVLLVDLDHPVKFPETHDHTVIIGFSATISDRVRSRADLLLPLPYPTAELQKILHRYGGYAVSTTEISHLPGCALLHGRRVTLSPLEERLFVLLLERRGQIVSTEELKRVIGDPNGTANTLQVLLYRLRKKLAHDGISRIRALRNKGYMLLDETRS